MESVQFRTAFGKRLRESREVVNMTQQELADKLDYSKSFISKVENGINEMPQSKIMRAAEVLGTTTAHLMGWDTGFTKSLHLSEEEFNLVTLFRTMNQDGRNAVLDMVSGLVQCGRYTEDTSSAVS